MMMMMTMMMMTTYDDDDDDDDGGLSCLSLGVLGIVKAPLRLFRQHPLD